MDTTLVGTSSPMRELRKKIRLYAGSDSPVLIQGETGVGKALVAWAIHDGSGREGQYVTCNVGAMSDPLHTRDELYGHMKGSYTSANGPREGLLKKADAGTLLLDEVGLIKESLHTLLLEASDNGGTKFKPIGSDTECRVDVRFVFATNRSLLGMAKQGEIPWDVYYRLSVLVIDVPPLRERGNDVILIAHHYLTKWGIGDWTITEPVKEFLTTYPWPGNVRELIAKMQLWRLHFKKTREVIMDDCWLKDMDIPVRPSHADPHDHGSATGDPVVQMNLNTDWENLRKGIMKVYLAYILDKAKGNKSLASRLTGINMSTLKRRLRDFGLST